MDYSPRRKICYRSLVMAIIMIYLGVQTQIDIFGDGLDLGWRDWLHSISGVLLFAFGFVMLLPRFRNIMAAIGLMCVGIGSSRLVVAISNTIQRTNVYELSGLLTLALGLFGYVMMWFAAYQIYRGTNFLRGNAMNAFIMRFTSMGIVLVYVLIVIYASVFLNISYETLWRTRSDFLTSPILYLMYFILLCSRDAFEYMEWERIRKGIIEVTVPLNPGLVTISEKERCRLQEIQSDFELWTSVDNGSPVEKEARFELITTNRPMELVLQKWRGSDAVYVTIVPGHNKEFISVIRGELGDMEFETDCVRINGIRHPIITIYFRETLNKTDKPSPKNKPGILKRFRKTEGTQ